LIRGPSGSYFLRMPVSGLLKLFVALLAAGVSTALSCEVGGWVIEEAPPSLPVALWLSALPGLGPEDPQCRLWYGRSIECRPHNLWTRSPQFRWPPSRHHPIHL
jgi:hypothetical protein